MKATDLMIGDWVLCDNTPYQIAEIGGMVCIDNENELFASLGDIQPIPLTAKILEKNGFKHITKYDTYRCQDGEIVIEVGIYHPDFVNIGYDYTTPNGRQKGEIASICKVDGADIYVHELQHALKLCGIEKEITL